MASLKERANNTAQRIQEQPLVARVMRMLKHYSEVRGSLQAGGVTYFGFLSVFPILALAFFSVGYIATVVPNAEEALQEAIEQILPGLVGDEEGQISLETFKQNASTIGLLGAVGLLYTGLGWLSSMRYALGTMFKKPLSERLNFVLGKLRDLTVLIAIGLTLLLSVALSAAINGFSEAILNLVGLDGSLLARWLLPIIGYAVALAATTVLFLAMYQLLARPNLPVRAVVYGALFAAVGFELLKALANTLLKTTQSSPAFQTFGVALILLVWIYYFSRLTMYGAAWAHTSPLAEHVDEPEIDASEAMGEPRIEPSAGVAPLRETAGGTDSNRSKRTLAIAGAAAGVAAVGAMALRKHQSSD